MNIVYHNHTLKNVPSVFHADGSLMRFRFHRVVHRIIERDYHRQLMEGEFSRLNETVLVETVEGKEVQWTLVDPNEARNFPVEIAMIQKSPEADEEFMRHAFTLTKLPPIYHWEGVYVDHACPTVDPSHVDSYHSPKKIVGIAIAHFRIWQEFYRRYRNGDQDKRILIFESGLRCAQDFCGDIALEQVASTTKDVFFIGWCHIELAATEPPYCLHAYSITVRAAGFLLSNFFPCDAPCDVTVQRLCKGGKLTWALASVENSPTPKYKTEGLMRQEW